MWETICDAWACWSGWNFGPNSTVYPYSVEYPPPPPSPPGNWNLGRSWHFKTFQFQNTPPPGKIAILADLGTLRLFSFRISDTNGKLCVASYHMWRLYPARITTRCDHCYSYFRYYDRGYLLEGIFQIAGNIEIERSLTDVSRDFNLRCTIFGIYHPPTPQLALHLPT